MPRLVCICSPLPVALLALVFQGTMAWHVVAALSTGQTPPELVTPALYLPTVPGGFVGAMALDALGWHGWALATILFNRLLDGLDGAVARQTGITDCGGFLDISLDFIFYAAVVLGFALGAPANALPAATLLFAFMGTGSSFLAFAIMAGKRGIENPVYHHKSLYYLGGLTEGSETIALFVLMCLWPAAFAPLAYGFALLCAITTLTRLWSGYHTLR